MSQKGTSLASGLRYPNRQGEVVDDQRGGAPLVNITFFSVWTCAKVRLGALSTPDSDYLKELLSICTLGRYSMGSTTRIKSPSALRIK